MRPADKTLATCHQEKSCDTEPRGGDRIMSIYFPTSSQCYWNVNYISKFVQPAVAKTAQRTTKVSSNSFLFLISWLLFSIVLRLGCLGKMSINPRVTRCDRKDEVGSLLLSKLKIYKIETKNWQDKEDEIKQIAFAALKLIIKVRIKQLPKTSSKEKSLRIFTDF